MIIKTQRKVYGKVLANLRIYQDFQEIGFDYIINPRTKELHNLNSNNFVGSHNLVNADLSTFIGIVNIGVIPIHSLQDGKIIPIYDLNTGDLIAEYELHKCKYCF